MVSEKSIEFRIRRTLEVLRDELRSSDRKRLYHVQYSSPLPVKVAGWQAFANQNPSSDVWEKWYVNRADGWLGRFHGNADEFVEFLEIAKAFHELTGRTLLDVVHDFAVLDATPLLRVIPDIWNWDPDEHLGDDGGVMDAEPFLEEWDESSSGDERFPKHPLLKSLRSNVYSASAIAIDLILNPMDFFVWRSFREDLLPMTVQNLAEEWEFHIWDKMPRLEQTESPANSETSPAIIPTSSADIATEAVQNPDVDYVFRKSEKGDVWYVRYTEAGHVEEDYFMNTKQIQRIAKLLMSPNVVILSIKFDASFDGRDSVSDEEAMQHLQGDDWDHQTSGAMPTKLTPLELNELRKSQEVLESEIANEGDENRKTQLKSIHRKDARKLYKKQDDGGLVSHAEKAHGMIKKSLYEGRLKFKKKMPLLFRHLETNIEAEGFGYVYRPYFPIHWST